MAKPYRCNRCGSTFTSKEGVNAHKRVKHRGYYYSLRIVPVILLIGLFAASLLIYFAPATTSTDAQKSSKSLWDVPLPLVTERGLSSDTIRLGSMKGKPAVVEFMVSWCPSCGKMAPVLEELHHRYGNSVSFVSIAGTWQGANEATTTEFIRKHRSSWPYALDRENAVFKYFDVRVVPTFLFFDSKGELVTKLEGEVTIERLSSELDRLK